MTKAELIAKWIPVLGGLGAFFEMLKAQHPDLAPLLDPKIAELNSKADAILLGDVVGVSLSELRKMFEEMKLDPRPHPDNLAA